MSRAPFPRKVSDFDKDERVSYSQTDGRWLLVDENKEEWEFNTTAQKWTQPATDEERAMYMQANYGGGSAADSDEQVVDVKLDKKRKQEAASAGASNKKAKVQKPQENRAIYVTNIPLDATKEEVEELFKKFGIIDRGADGNNRVKMYADEEGKFNGEALIVYFRKESVPMAIRMQDDYPFRLGDQSTKTTVQEADMSYKKNAGGQEVREKLVRRDKKAAERHRAEMNRKLAEWSDNEDIVQKTYALPKNKWAKVAIIKHAFSLDELENEEVIKEIMSDMRDKAEKCGEVAKVVVFDKEPEGIVTVRFRQQEHAEAYVKKINGRRYSGRKLSVTLAEDRPVFKKTLKIRTDSSDDLEGLDGLVDDEE